MIKDILRDFINSKKASRDKEQLLSSNTNKICFIPNTELWQKILDFIKSDDITDEQLEDLISVLSEKEDTFFVEQIKKEIENNYDYSECIRKKHPTITATELQICCYIAQGKSSEEMAKLMGVGISTITSNRSRLRTKLGLTRNKNLKVYLDSITPLK